MKRRSRRIGRERDRFEETHVADFGRSRVQAEACPALRSRALTTGMETITLSLLSAVPGITGGCNWKPIKLSDLEMRGIMAAFDRFPLQQKTSRPEGEHVRPHSRTGRSAVGADYWG